MDRYLGIYIHIPFCASRCAYCDFYTRADHNEWMDAYQEALLTHIRETAPQLGGYYIDTVYFGGGTPSFYGTNRLIELFETLKRCGRVLVNSEVTVEVNPDSISISDLVKLRKAGFNRLSIGAQCADDGILRSIGRRHNFEQVTETVISARRAGFENISLDLIYGLPSQTREGWASTLMQAMALKPEHLSCYGLKIEEGTPLWEYKDSPFIPDDDTQADMYLYTVETLSRNGLKQYEISNFALPGYHSRHNMKYWVGAEYMSFGAAAHSYMDGRRYSFVSDLEAYINGVMSGGTIIDHSEAITPYEQASEYIMLGLRTSRGIRREEYEAIYPLSFAASEKLLQDFFRHGWAVQNNGRWSFTTQGMLLSNALIGMLLEAQSNQRAAASTPWRQNVDESQGTLFGESAGNVPLFRGISG